MKRDESDSKFEIQKLIDQNEIFVVEATQYHKDIETNESQIQNLQNLNGALQETVKDLELKIHS